MSMLTRFGYRVLRSYLKYSSLTLHLDEVRKIPCVGAYVQASGTCTVLLHPYNVQLHASSI